MQFSRIKSSTGLGAGLVVSLAMSEELNLEQRLTDVIEASSGPPKDDLEVVKMRLNHYDPLVVLCVGTLALTFTGALNFHGHPGTVLNLHGSSDLLRA